MPCYNSENTISEAIASVLKQYYINWELLIVDDASSDNSLFIISKFNDKRIKLNKNLINVGISESRNRAISLARGRYIAFLDSDDLWLPEKLSKQIPLLDADEAAVCSHTSYIRFNETNSCLGNVIARDKVTLGLMQKGNFIGNLTGVIDRKKVGTIFQKNVRHEDYLMWLDVLSKVEGSHSIGIKEVLSKYRVSSSSISSNKVKSASWHWNILRSERKMNCISASYYLFNYIYNAFKRRR